MYSGSLIPNNVSIARSWSPPTDSNTDCLETIYSDQFGLSMNTNDEELDLDSGGTYSTRSSKSGNMERREATRGSVGVWRGSWASVALGTGVGAEAGTGVGAGNSEVRGRTVAGSAVGAAAATGCAAGVVGAGTPGASSNGFSAGGDGATPVAVLGLVIAGVSAVGVSEVGGISMGGGVEAVVSLSAMMVGGQGGMGH